MVACTAVSKGTIPLGRAPIGSSRVGFDPVLGSDPGNPDRIRIYPGIKSLYLRK
jgi:hypothetical protein